MNYKNTMSSNTNPSHKTSSDNIPKHSMGKLEDAKPEMIVTSEPVRSSDFGEGFEIEKPITYIANNNHRKFIITSSLLVFFCHVPFLIMFVLYMVKGLNTNAYINTFFFGDRNMYLGYAITCCVLFFLIMIATSILPFLGRKGLQYPLFFALWISILYMTMYGFWKESQGRYLFESDMTLIFFGCAFYGSSFGLVVTAYLTKRRVDKKIGLAIALANEVMVMFLLFYYRPLASPKIWQYFLYLMFTAFLSIYYTTDLDMMLKKRSHFYRTNDWFLGMVHLQTDLFFRVWWDLFVKRKTHTNDLKMPIPIDTPDENIAPDAHEE